jgi:hypothetical protein
MPFHNLQQNPVPILVPEQLNGGLWCQGLFQSVKTLLLNPVTADTLIHNTRTVLLHCELKEPFSDHLGHTCALILAEKLITELDDVISKGVLDDLVNAESHFVDELLLGL